MRRKNKPSLVALPFLTNEPVALLFIHMQYTLIEDNSDTTNTSWAQRRFLTVI